MPSCLVIVESAAKASIIAKYLAGLYPESKWTVIACFGHIRDLPLKTLGVNTETWKVEYELLAAKKDTISRLKKASKDVDRVYLASDPDLEGHAIAYHLQVSLRLPLKKCTRVTFNEITRSALKEAFDHPSGWNNAKVEAQETRRILDRLVGYKVSPLLWQHFAGGPRGLSAGRVQSTALRMVMQRHSDFIAHESQKTWMLRGTFPPLETHCDLVIDSIDLAHSHLQKIIKYTVKSNVWKVAFTSKTVKKLAPLAYTTSSLQQEAYTHHRINAKSTMALAQALYEEGFITYMRTDSSTLSEDFTAQLLSHIETAYTAESVGEPRKAKQQVNAQEAHEAVRPTNLDVTDEGISFKSHSLTPFHVKLYDLIWRRTVASGMAPAKYNEISFTVTSPQLKLASYIFTGKTSLLTFAGFLRVMSPNIRVDAQSLQTWQYLMEQKKDVSLTVMNAECMLSKPRLLFTETDLIKGMEKNGIGRPSTYVSIIDKLLSKNYCVKGAGPSKSVELKHLTWRTDEPDAVKHEISTCTIGGNDNDRLVPTELGISIDAYIQQHFSELVDVGFTANMEADLDKIEKGTDSKDAVLARFYQPFETKLNTAASHHTSSTGTGTGTCTGTGKRARGAGGRTAADFTHFMKWCGVSTISEQDRQVLERLPQQINGSQGRVMMGPYGVYIRTHDNKNKRLDKALWPKVVSNTLSESDITG